MLSFKSVGFSTSRLHTVHLVLSDNGCDKCICSFSESSNVISVVSEAQWKSYILKVCKKPEKSCLLSTYWKVLGSCILQDCICFMVKSIFIGQQLSQLVPSWIFFCENAETLARFVFSWPTYCHINLPPPPPLPQKALVLVLARMFTMSSFCLCVRKFSTLRPPCSPTLQEFV